MNNTYLIFDIATGYFDVRFVKKYQIMHQKRKGEKGGKGSSLQTTTTRQICNQMISTHLVKILPFPSMISLLVYVGTPKEYLFPDHLRSTFQSISIYPTMYNIDGAT